MLDAMSQDRLERRDVHLRIGSDRVVTACVELLERVGHVAGEHHVPARVIDADHRDVTRRVSRGIDDHDAAVHAVESMSTDV